jgi:hypothetical protein
LQEMSRAELTKHVEVPLQGTHCVRPHNPGRRVACPGLR